MSTSRRGKLFVMGYALLNAAVILYFCTKSSFGYPMNDWCDANIYLSIGKGMTRGLVVYRDLYDHKGPLLYGLHALCALISSQDFLGVFIVEVLLAAAFLYYAWQLLTLYGARRTAWIAIPALALAVYSAYSFSEGDSAEELCMPFMMASLYYALKYLRSGDSRMSAGGLIAQGLLAGCVLWMKFTAIGLQAGILLTLVVCSARTRRASDVFRALGLMLAGFAISTVPWVVYFGLNGAILPWLKVYFYDNLVLYGGEAYPIVERIKLMLGYCFDWVVRNLRYTLLIILGLMWLLISRRRAKAPERLCAWLAAGLGALVVFMGCKDYPYYGQALAPLASLGMIPLCLLLEKGLHKCGRGALAGVGAGVCALCLALCPFVARNMNAAYGAAFGQSREETMQYRFAAEINQTPGATLLNYGFMDAGFYTAAGIVPNVKYFHENNVPLPEMREEQARYLSEALCDYVVTRGTEPESISECYELIDTADTPGFWYDKAYLYRRKGLGK